MFKDVSVLSGSLFGCLLHCPFITSKQVIYTIWGKTYRPNSSGGWRRLEVSFTIHEPSLSIWLCDDGEKTMAAPAWSVLVLLPVLSSYNRWKGQQRPSCHYIVYSHVGADCYGRPRVLASWMVAEVAGSQCPGPRYCHCRRHHCGHCCHLCGCYSSQEWHWELETARWG